MRSAALASSVVASTPTVSPLASSAARSLSSTQAKTCLCVSRSMRCRVRQSGEGVRRRLVESVAEALADRERVAGLQGDGALGMEAQQVAEQEPAEVDVRRQRGTAQHGGVEGLAEPFQALVEAGALEHLVELLAARDGRGLGEFVRREADAPLNPLASAQRHLNKDPTECSRAASPRAQRRSAGLSQRAPRLADYFDGERGLRRRAPRHPLRTAATPDRVGPQT